MKVRLETTMGFIAAKAAIPDFMADPQVLVWGSRVFYRFGAADDEASEERVYREAFAYTIPPSDVDQPTQGAT